MSLEEEDEDMAGMQACKTVVALAGFLLMLAMPVSAAQRVALVIGNGAYVNEAPLRNPPNDAADISAALGRLGFEVMQIKDVGKSDLEKGLQKLTRAAATSDIAIVFYAGHGIEVDKRNFLVPVDARLESDQDVEFEAVPLDLALRAVGRASGLGLVILDACRNNPFVASMQRSGATRAVGRGLVRVEPKAKQTLVAYAAREGATADDGEGRNSPYTTALLRYLEEPGLEISRMFRKVRDAVLSATGDRQQPFTSGSLSSEDIYLAADPGQTRWETVRQATDPSVLRSFMKEFPNSQFVAQAREKLTELARAHWEAIKDSDKPSELRAFLIAFPEDRLAEVVEARLTRLQRSLQVGRCDAHLQAERLSSAARCYRNVLRDDPDHELAKEGLVAIADVYSHAAEDALRQAQTQARSYEDALRQVEGHVERLRQTDAEHPSIAGLRTALQRLRVNDAGQLENLRSRIRQLQAAAEAWDRVQNSSQAADYEAFLSRYGESHFAKAARRRLEEIEATTRRWEAIKDSTRAADFESLLRTVLQGGPAVQAFERWKALRLEEKDTPSGTPEALAWEEIRDSTRVSDVEAFLRDYPNGRFAAEARRRLGDMQLSIRLDQCAAQLQAKRLSASDGALACYREVLRKDPGNAQAKRGLQEVAGLYYQWAEKAIAQETFQQAENYLQRLRRINAAHRGHLSIAALQSRLHAKQREHEESREWNRIKNFRTTEALETFLRNYPNGRYAAVARRRLNELQKEGREAREWNRIKNFRAPGVFKTFLKDYPNGRYAVQARRRLNELQKEGQEAREWNRIKNFRAPGVFETFLKDYPNGRYAVQARRRLSELQKEGQEAREWNRIKNFRTAGAFETFLRTYPNGRFAAAARRRLSELRKPASAKAGEDSLRLAHADRRLIQLGLSEAGFNPGGADGVFGPRTRAAIRRWQSSRGHSSTGYLDARSAETLRALGKRRNQQAEIAEWNRIKSLSYAANFEAFLRDYPNSRFANEARRRLNELRTSGSVGGDVREWNRIKSLSYAANFEAFLRDYPNSRFAGEARRRLNGLRKPASPGGGLRHGTKTYSNGRYVGQLRGDKPHGRGTMTWNNGDRYEGDWRGDKRHGRGTMTWNNGDRYEGQWRDDKPHGQGTLTWANGSREAGQWRNGCFGSRGGRWTYINTTAKACGFE